MRVFICVITSFAINRTRNNRSIIRYPVTHICNICTYLAKADSLSIYIKKSLIDFVKKLIDVIIVMAVTETSV